MQYSFFLTALCASRALAIMVTSPAMNADWKDNDSNTITWTSVSSDQQSLNILLVNEQVNPPTSITLATNVPTSKGSYTVTSLTGTGQGYQINLVSTTQQGGILAQSQQFELEAGGSASSSAATSGTSSTASTATPVTSTLTKTSTLSGAGSATTTTVTGTVTGTTSGVTLATVTTSKGTATGSATGVVTGSASGTATASTTAATGSSGADAKVASLAGVALAGLFALLV